jgi:nucleoside-diphosphate-sugar epimerase
VGTLITGATGFVGRHLAARLPGSHTDRLELTRPLPVLPPVTTVFHCAAEIDDETTMRAVNVEGTARLLDWAAQVGVQTFVFVSTGGIDAPGLYQATKREAEALVGEVQGVGSVHVVRLFFPYGPGQGARRLVPRLVARVRADQPVVVGPDGGPWLSLTHVADVAEALLHVAPLPGRHVLEVGGPPVALRDVALGIGDAIGRPPVFERAARPSASYVADTRRLRELTGFSPAIRIEEGIPGCV